jgi:hypothetical protein
MNNVTKPVISSIYYILALQSENLHLFNFTVNMHLLVLTVWFGFYIQVVVNRQKYNVYIFDFLFCFLLNVKVTRCRDRYEH